MPTLTIPAPDPAMRWGIRVTPDSHSRPQCRFCGHLPFASVNGRDCRAGVCLACGSRQCNNRPDCSVCLIGILPDWSGWQRACGYAGCTEQAVAKAPRVRFVCATHWDRPTRRWAGKRISVADDIARRLAVRDGREREQFPLHRYVLLPEVQSR